MKLTKREAFLLKLAFVVALLAASYYFVIAPQLDKLAATGVDLLAKSQEVEMVKAEINSLPQLDEEIKALHEGIRITSERFYPDLIQKKLIVILNDLLVNSGVQADSINFSEPGAVESADSGNSNNAQAEGTGSGNSAGIGNPQIRSMSVQYPILGTYEQVMDLIKRIEGLNRMIVIKNLQLAESTGGILSGAISLDFYSMEKVSADSKDEDYLDWPYDSPKGVDNPFRFTPSNEPAEQEESEQTEGNESEQAEGNETQTP